MDRNHRSHPQHPLYYGQIQAYQIPVDTIKSFEADLDINWSQVFDTPTTRDGYGITDVYTMAEADALFLTAAEADALFLTPAEGDAAYSPLGHTHDTRYYTETELDAGQLDNRYYTETEVDALLAAIDFPVDSVFGRTGAVVATAGDYDAFYYTEAEVDALLAGLSIPVNLDDLGDVNAPTPSDGDVVTWDAGTSKWIAAAPTGGGGTIDGSGTANTLAKWSDSDTLTDSIITDDGTTVAVGAYDSDMNPNASPLFVNTRLNVVRATSAGILDLGRANTSFGSPTALANGDSMGTLQFNGWDGSAMSRGAFITANAKEAWTGSARGTSLLFRTTPLGSTTQTQALELDPSQNMILAGNRFTFGPSGSCWIEEDELDPDQMNIGTDSATDNIWLYFGGSSRIGFSTSGIFPGSDNTVDLGSTSLRFRDLKGAGEVKWGDFSSAFRYAWIDDTLGYRLTLRTDDNAPTTPLYIQNADFGTAYPSRAVRLQFFGGTAQAGTPINAGMIEVGPTQAWTSTTSTQDAIMVFHLALNGTLTEIVRMTQTTSPSVRFTGTIDFTTNNTYDIGTSGNFPRNIGAATAFNVSGTQVVAARRTGWATPTATLSRTAIATGDAAATINSHLAALVTDLIAHGLIGA